jgi:hypothetical protein
MKPALTKSESPPAVKRARTDEKTSLDKLIDVYMLKATATLDRGGDRQDGYKDLYFAQVKANKELEEKYFKLREEIWELKMTMRQQQ